MISFINEPQANLLIKKPKQHEQSKNRRKSPNPFQIRIGFLWKNHQQDARIC
ncbi:hypothetical protein LINPERPRIM_LOCUS9106 [Linum perenne]